MQCRKDITTSLDISGYIGFHCRGISREQSPTLLFVSPSSPPVVTRHRYTNAHAAVCRHRRAVVGRAGRLLPVADAGDPSTGQRDRVGRTLLIASATEQQAQVAQQVDSNLGSIRQLSVRTAASAQQNSLPSQRLA